MPTALIRLLVDASATLSDKLDILLKMSSTSSLGKLERGNLGDPTRFGDLDPNLFGDLDLHLYGDLDLHLFGDLDLHLLGDLRDLVIYCKKINSHHFDWRGKSKSYRVSS